MIYTNHKENIIVTRSGNRLISHRGNITGKTKHENDPEYIVTALDQGYDVEVDVSFKDNNFWLGHDKKKYRINIDFLNDNRLWCHLKNTECLKQIVDILKNEHNIAMGKSAGSRTINTDQLKAFTKTQLQEINKKSQNLPD